MRQATEWTPLEGLRQYGLILLKKMGFIAIGWVIVYFISHPFRISGEFNVLMLFSPLIGAFAGVGIGWYLAENAVEDSPLLGMGLWVTLTAAGWAAIWVVEGVLHRIMHRPIEFGGWMLISTAMILSMAAAVWRSSADQ